VSALAARAKALAELMALAEEIGASARIAEDGVHLVGPADAAPRRIGATVAEAVRTLRADGTDRAHVVPL
jgi:hypothetical protein